MIDPNQDPAVVADAALDELSALRALRSRAVEARTPDALFRGAIDALAQSVPFEAIAIVYGRANERRADLFVNAPLTESFSASLIDYGARLMGWPAAERIGFESHALVGAARGGAPRERLVEQALVVVPMSDSGRPEGYFVVQPSSSAREPHLRLLCTAGTELYGHLQRIRADREEESVRVAAILDALPQAVWLCDPRLVPVRRNRTAAEWVAAGWPSGDPAAFAARHDLGDLIEAAKLDPAAQRRELELEQGRRIDVSIRRCAVPGGLDGLLIVLDDVTQERRMQAQLAQSDKLTSLGQMISGVAHELNNPLATILGSAQLLRAMGGDERQQRRLDILEEEAQRCRHVVQNLLSFARKHDPEIKQLGLNEIARSVVALLEYQCRVDGVRLESRLDPELPAIAADAHQIKQVLVNLVNNARQAMVEAGSEGRVELRSQAIDGGVRIEVADEGPGIPAALRDRIFEPFFTTKAEGEGTGLGLSIVYGIVRSHDGTIAALERSGGATFRIELPLGRVPTAEVAEPEPRRASTTAGRILVVDDEQPFARLLVDALTARGHHAECLFTAEEALERVASEPFDLVLSDVRMPGTGARGLLEQIEALAPALAGRVLLMSGDAVGAEARELGERHEIDVMAKPFDLDALLDRISARLAD